ncbi:MAG TPA: GDP-mannose 4,6-dehydratase [Acidimicrobiales bacterium]|nr:GDP-mannose 4,6-dehydratase [Acidimicrobiales bacterium]
MRAFLTGASGFVGGWLARHLREQGDDVAGLEPGRDIGDAGALRGDLQAAAPDVVYHLAGLAHVGLSWDEPGETFRVNALGTLNLVEAALACARPPRIMLISSAEVYGRGDGTPLAEDAPLRPVSPYASSKVAAEFVGLQAFLGNGLEVVRARPFNHVGPGQADSFVVSALARRIAEAERAGGGEVRIGNLTAARDFTDVRDVVSAYRLLATAGVPGEVYNVCSGSAITTEELFRRMVAMAKVPIEPVQDPSLFRPVDVPVLLGDGTRLTALTGWRPEIPLDSTLLDTLDYWRERSGAD